jgi:outer membrane protein TolC
VIGAARLGGMLLLLAVCGASASADELPGADLDSLLAYAREHSPELAGRRLEALAAAERAASAGNLADPQLRIELQDITRGGTANPQIMPAQTGSTRYTVLQPLPFWGKRELRRQAAEAEAQAVRATVDVGWTDLSARIRSEFARYYIVDREIVEMRRVVDLFRRIADIARTRYSQGLAGQQDAIRALAEGTSAEGELIGLDLDLHHAMTRLNALLARAPHEPLAKPLRLPDVPVVAALESGRLQEHLQARNPQLAADAARVTAAERGYSLAMRNRWPDAQVGLASLQTGNRVSEWGLMLEINIPLQQGSRRAQEREAEMMLESARARRQATAIDLAGQLAENLSALEAARRLESLTTASLVPQSELAFESALAGYEAGRGDFASVLETLRQVRQARLSLLRAQLEQQIRSAEIGRLTGDGT